MRWASHLAIQDNIEACIDEAVEAVRGQLENAPAHLTVIFVSPQFKERYDEIPGMISQRMDPGCFLDLKTRIDRF